MVEVEMEYIMGEKKMDNVAREATTSEEPNRCSREVPQE